MGQLRAAALSGVRGRDEVMVFTRRLREGVRRGRITCSIRIWTRLQVKVGGRYPMDDGHIVVDSIAPMKLREITRDLARESGFDSVKDLLGVAKHGQGRNAYLVRFHYLPPGAWDSPPSGVDRIERAWRRKRATD
jgi:hypothetical protein